MKTLTRKQIRLKNYDYSQNGWYFVTICTQDRKNIFGEIISERMTLNDIGEIVKNEWLKTSQIRKYINLDICQIMPNHIHGIIHIVGAPLVGACSIMITHSNRAGIKPALRAGMKPALRAGIKPALRAGIKPALRAGMKPAPTDKISLTTHEYIRNVKNNNWLSFNKRLWQRNFYEHIIRNEKELERIRQYINLNPMMWSKDRDNPDNINL